MPEYMAEIVAELTHLARRSSEISQRSGVSVRVSICNYENMVSNALKRAIRLRETRCLPARSSAWMRGAPYVQRLRSCSARICSVSAALA